MAGFQQRSVPQTSHANSKDHHTQQHRIYEDEDRLDDSKDTFEESERTKTASSEEDSEPEDSVLEDMERFEQSFKGITKRYRLINRIGEGTFSTVYKAEDLLYDQYRNSWDIEEKENIKWSPSGRKVQQHQQKPRYVAIKKIYVTSSPLRILNELDLLHDLENHDSVCPLITAFRHQDQVIAILPYFRHVDFRLFFRQMTSEDMRIYFRSLFTALAAVHEHNILHRDIKPTNFLYDPRRKRGVLVDFGLAERHGVDSQPCLCQLEKAERKKRIDHSYCGTHEPMVGYPKDDRRPTLRANRAGTRGFRAPEVLFKCTAQSTKIDIWAAGIILLTILAARFPFFNSADDIDAVIELAHVFGRQKMRACALLHGQVFDITIPTVQESGYSLEKIILWSNNKQGRNADGQKVKFEPEEILDFLSRCLELDPDKRISAEEALQHPFLSSEASSEDEVDVLSQ